MEYLVDVKPIIENRDEKIVVEDSTDLEPLRVIGENVNVEEPANFKISLTNVGAGVLAEGDSFAKVKLLCSRCLDDFTHRVKGEISDLFNFEKPSSEENVEEKIYHVFGTKIDLYPSIRDSIGLALPIRLLCRIDCKGLCVVCGANLNMEICEHQARIEAE